MMLQHPTLDRLNAMGLAGMARAFGELAANAEAERLTHPEWLALLLDREWGFRHDRKLAARLRFAKLRHQAAPEDVDYRSHRGLDRGLFLKLVAGDWIAAHDNLVICGRPASGNHGWPVRWATRPVATTDPCCISACPSCSPAWHWHAATDAMPASWPSLAASSS
jgi:hypothetical protein